MTLRMLATAGLVSAFTLSALAPTVVAQDDLPKLEDLAKDRAVTFVSAGTLFVPGRNGSGPRLVSGEKHWLVYRRGELLGLVEQPEGGMKPGQPAKLLDYRKEHPDSFAMPGIVDADSRWFRAAKDMSDRSADPTAKATDGLETWQKGWKELLVDAGVTTVFVPTSVMAQTTGEGALIGLTTREPSVLADGALSWRLSSPQTSGTNLTRSNVTKGLAAAFSAARKYDEAKEKHAKSVEEFEKKRKEFLAYYKKNPLKKGEEVKTAAPQPTRARRGRLPRTAEELERLLQRVPPAMRDRVRKQMEAQMKAAADAEKAAKAKAAAAAKPAKPDPKAGTAKKAPPKPTRPKPFKRDEKNEALLRVLAGKSALRIEVHRAGEIKALLDLAEEESIERIVIVGATEAWKVAKDLRVAGAQVVLRPEALPTKGFDTLPEQLAASAAKLTAEGVAVAFGSAGRARGRNLPLVAARAVANGMDETDALQALTQGGIEMSGVAPETSVDTGIVVWSGHPLATTSRPIAVVRGRRAQKLSTSEGEGNK